MSEQPANRRRFKRIAFDARTELSQGQFIWPVKLIDLSLKGLLIERPEPWLGDKEQDFFVDIHLSDDVDIQMDVHLAHEDHGQLGFVCRHISLESIQRLRRLIELNLADEAELERELGALIEI
ncbi:PilZ domain-containing protein [Pseudomonas koreensis]|uniref:PilZ domain-containing protein n=1 Tax=Pseudomonas TaxID=286 RepID=UPI000597CC6C|nr:MULTISPECIES: PilZ domain-containing protein [Pseudomonas]KIK88925.1 pilus assembly protein [Pseudomonas sp. W15Feb9B]MBA5980495.1 PilZ domain-containing protein [Pseudomonas sp. MD195_PC81_125]MBI6946092.1 PilZ domain-containing protein [Pseudomonas koreensis]NTZ95794.1 PilZ domain-containing protein [Pseudomonas koreensis]QXE11842.1 PilZ domain-containing protein [Pseudomonas sp. AN-B15]